MEMTIRPSDELICVSLSGLDEVARELLRKYPGDRVFSFSGEMGAGKTTFIKALCRQLQVKDVTASPTFALVHEYQSTGGPVYHFDFYRLKKKEEAFDLGYEDYFYSGSYCFIEWPEKIEELLPSGSLRIHITKQGETRLFNITRI